MTAYHDLETVAGLELTRLDQLYGHDGTGRRPLGDCYRTAIACILGATRANSVPHFVDQAEDLVDPEYVLGWEAHRLARRWLRELGVDLCPIALPAAIELGVPFLASVQSKRGEWGHIVVAQGAAIAHDPAGTALERAGLPAVTWADVVEYAERDEPGVATGDVIVKPYSPDPDEQLATWADWHRERGTLEVPA